jgi:solute carrier family 7 (L-type amino acid transporter), member 6
MATDSQRQGQGLLEGYRHGEGAFELETPSRSPSRSDDERLPPALSTLRLRSSLPLTTTTTNSLTYLNCLSLVVGLQIGSGIFSAPAVVSNHVPTPAAGVLIWVFAGILVWTGASCFIELGTTIPLNGGMQEYLRAGYDDFAGFLFSWVWLSIVRPCTIAMVAMIFAEHVNGVALPALGVPGGWVADKGVALVGVWGITGVNCLGVKTGARVATWFLVLKLMTISSIVGAGMVVGIREKGGYLVRGPEKGQRAMGMIKYGEQGGENGLWMVFGEYVTAALAALWVYGGWEAVSVEYSIRPLIMRSPVAQYC